MKDRVHKFLAESGGHASSLAIAAHVLHLRNATPAIAERVVAGLLNEDARFAADGVGNWYLTQSASGADENSLDQTCVIFTPMRTVELANAGRVVLGWSFASTAELNFFEIPLRNVSAEESGCAKLSREEFAQRYLPDLQRRVLVSWNPGAARLTLRKITAHDPAAWLPATIISLQNLSRNLLRSSRKPKLATAYRELFNAPVRSGSWEDQLRAHAEIWQALYPRCCAQGLLSWEQIAHYARRPLRADFVEYAFDEKYIDDLPETPGVYVMKDREGRVLYVGKAVNLRERVRSYFGPQFTEEAKLQQIRKRVVHLRYEVFDTELEALLREQVLIKRFRPAVNRQREVHAPQAARPKKACGIFVVPVLRDAAHAPETEKRAVVYFLSAGNLKRVAVTLKRIPKQRLKKVVAEYARQYQHPSPATAAQRTQVEIAGRWFHQNRAWVSMVDPEDCGEAAALETRLLRLLQAPEIFHERVLLAANEVLPASHQTPRENLVVTTSERRNLA